MAELYENDRPIFELQVEIDRMLAFPDLVGLEEPKTSRPTSVRSLVPSFYRSLRGDCRTTRVGFELKPEGVLGRGVATDMANFAVGREMDEGVEDLLGIAADFGGDVIGSFFQGGEVSADLIQEI